jgi:tetratricopeptide (TPR) repeat protein
MKTTTFFLFLLISIYSFGQNNVSNEDQILFERTSAIESISGELCLGCRGSKENLNQKDSLKIEIGTELEKQICEIAIENYSKLIDSFPKSKFVYKALMRKAENEFYLKKYTEAKISFERILKSEELNPNSEYFYNVQEAYYKNSSALNLAEIYITEKNFEKAILYLNESKKYKVKFMCGNSYIERSENLKKLYDLCETELKKNKK